MKTSDFHYHLPKEYIAQTPVEPRDSARLLVYERQTGNVSHRIFRDLEYLLSPDDLLVVNKSRVIPARLYGKKILTGGKVEVLLLERQHPQVWRCLVGGKGLREGTGIQLTGGPRAEIVRELEGPLRVIKFSETLVPYLDQIGQMPLPPYIHEQLEDPERYQTVFSQVKGSAAAPTAGLHFTPQLLGRIQSRGVGLAEVVLHVGLDTFAPVREEDPRDHRIHTEWCSLSEETAQAIRRTKASGGKVIAVGTTSARTLESAGLDSSNPDQLQPYSGYTDLFILPGYRFQVVDSLLTNFHLPESTLLMMVSAFAGREKILNLYQLAIREKYRFYSFGDAMLLE